MKPPSEVISEEGPFSGPGPTLYQRSVRPASTPLARLGIIHGYGDHCGRYLHFMHWLAQRGIAAHAFDYRGHGLAKGRRGYIRRWSEYLDDLDAFLALPALHADPAAPLFLLGHSHGGLLLIARARRGFPDVSGLVLSAPYLRSLVPVSRQKAVVGQIANRLLPGLHLGTGLQPDWLSSDPEMIKDSRNDPLCLHIATPRWWIQVQQMQQQILADMPQLTCPLLMLIAENDRIAHPPTARRFFDEVCCADKTLHTYPMRHEILRESGRERVFEDIVAWMSDA